MTTPVGPKLEWRGKLDVAYSHSRIKIGKSLKYRAFFTLLYIYTFYIDKTLVLYTSNTSLK